MLKGVLVAIMMLFWCVNCFSQIAWQDSITVQMNAIAAADSDSLKLERAENIVTILQEVSYGGDNSGTKLAYMRYRKAFNTDIELYAWSVPLSIGDAYYNIFKLKDGKSFVFEHIPGKKEGEIPFLLYDILGFVSEGQEYTVLFGWTRHRNTDRKVLFIADFNGEKPLFDKALFVKENQSIASYSVEYAKDTGMAMQYDKNGKRIVLDNLAPLAPQYEGVYGLYVATGSYDAFVLERGRWVWKENIKL